MQKNWAGLQRLLAMVDDQSVKYFAIRSIVISALDRGERASLSTVLAEHSAPDRELAEALLLVEDESVHFHEGITQALRFRNQNALESAIGGLVNRQLSEDFHQSWRASPPAS